MYAIRSYYASNHGGSHATPASFLEYRIERDRCHAERGNPDDPDVLLGGSGPHPGRDGGFGEGIRGRARREDLRAVLHDETEGHRAGPGDFEATCRAARRSYNFV